MRTSTVRLPLAVLALSLAALVSLVDIARAAPPGGGPPKKGDIVVEVVGPDGPVGGATVLLFDGVAIDQVDETVTDANGNFQFRRVAEGDYTLTAISWNPPCTGNASVTVQAKKQVVVVIACD